MKINKTKVLIIIILGISILASQIIYIIIFHGGLSRKQSVWGDFGSFFGGFIGTILGFINLLFLIQTIGIQNDQLKLMKDDFQIQINAREKSESKERYYYYEKIDRFNRRLFSFSNGNIWNYNNYNNTLKIIYKTNSEQDALNRLKEILDSDSIQSGILFSTKYNI